jgi:hypothetical protein
MDTQEKYKFISKTAVLLTAHPLLSSFLCLIVQFMAGNFGIYGGTMPY